MYKQLMGKIAALAIMAGAAGWFAAPQVAKAGNPKGFGPLFTGQSTPWLHADKPGKWVNFIAWVDGSGCFVDVDFWTITSNTNYTVQALVKCVGAQNTSRTVNGSSSNVQDIIYFCPGGGEAMQGGLGITN